jgi:hypothetical protein
MITVILEGLRKIPDVHLSRANLLYEVSSATLETRASCETLINKYVAFCDTPMDTKLGSGSFRILETGLKKANYFSNNKEEDSFI